MGRADRIREPDAGVARDQDVLRLEIEVHEPALMHMFEGGGHVDDDVRHVLEQHRVWSLYISLSSSLPRIP